MTEGEGVGYSPGDFPVTRRGGEHPTPSQSRFILFLVMLAAALIAMTPLFERPLWHDEAQVAFGARQWLETGKRRFCDEKSVVGENLHHALNAEGDLPLMSPMENWLAALGGWTSDQDWRMARWPFFVCSLLALGVVAGGVGRLTGSASAVLLGALVWGLNPWVWSLAVQLRYYPVVWLLVAWGVVTVMGGQGVFPWRLPRDSSLRGTPPAPLQGLLVHSIHLLTLYLTNWVVALCWIPVALVMQALADKRRLSAMLGGYGFAMGLMALHASLGSDLAAWVLMLPDRASQALRVLAWHASEFNLDVFPVALLALMVLTGWRARVLRPLLAGSCLVGLMLCIPSFYTRLALMFLPLFVLALAQWLWHLSASRPVWAMAVGTLAIGTYAFQVLPFAMASSLSERAARWSMPLTREAGRAVTNTRDAWQAVIDPWPGREGRRSIHVCLQDGKKTKETWPLEGLALWLKDSVKEGEQVICAMDGTALELMTGLTFNWRVPEWGAGRALAPNLKSPEGVKYVVLRTQHPFLTREVTWTNEILRGLEKGWLKGQPVILPFDDVKYFNSPFPFTMHRQSWPSVTALQVWVLDHPVTAVEAQKLLPLRDRRLLRPPGLDPLLDPDEVWGLPR
ncbi:MAG: hypothetical protein AB7F75_03595 [Planctomycetota bacterium]